MQRLFTISLGHDPVDLARSCSKSERLLFQDQPQANPPMESDEMKNKPDDQFDRIKWIALNDYRTPARHFRRNGIHSCNARLAFCCFEWSSKRYWFNATFQQRGSAVCIQSLFGAAESISNWSTNGVHRNRPRSFKSMRLMSQTKINLKNSLGRLNRQKQSKRFKCETSWTSSCKLLSIRQR